MFEKIQIRLKELHLPIPDEFNEKAHAFYDTHQAHPAAVFKILYAWLLALELSNRKALADENLNKIIPALLSEEKIHTLPELARNILLDESILREFCHEHNATLEEFSEFNAENNCARFLYPYLAEEYLNNGINIFQFH